MPWILLLSQRSELSGLDFVDKKHDQRSSNESPYLEKNHFAILEAKPEHKGRWTGNFTL